MQGRVLEEIGRLKLMFSTLESSSREGISQLQAELAQALGAGLQPRLESLDREKEAEEAELGLLGG